MLFGVRDQEFDITFVNNYVRELYQDMLTVIDDLSDLPGEVDEVSDDETMDKREKIKRIREMQKAQRAMVRKIAEIREEIVREILTTNGYEYDEKWWSRKCDADDMNNLALGALQKDLKESSATKKKP